MPFISKAGPQNCSCMRTVAWRAGQKPEVAVPRPPLPSPLCNWERHSSSLVPKRLSQVARKRENRFLTDLCSELTSVFLRVFLVLEWGVLEALEQEGKSCTITLPLVSCGTWAHPLPSHLLK